MGPESPVPVLPGARLEIAEELAERGRTHCRGIPEVQCDELQPVAEGRVVRLAGRVGLGLGLESRGHHDVGACPQQPKSGGTSDLDPAACHQGPPARDRERRGPFLGAQAGAGWTELVEIGIDLPVALPAHVALGCPSHLDGGLAGLAAEEGPGGVSKHGSALLGGLLPSPDGRRRQIPVFLAERLGALDAPELPNPLVDLREDAFQGLSLRLRDDTPRGVPQATMVSSTSMQVLRSASVKERDAMKHLCKTRRGTGWSRTSLLGLV
jgi:hypothetical protein